MLLQSFVSNFIIPAMTCTGVRNTIPWHLQVWWSPVISDQITFWRYQHAAVLQMHPESHIMAIRSTTNLIHLE